MVGIRRCSRNPVCHRACFVDAFLQNLTVLRFLVEHHLVAIFGCVGLTQRVVDADGAEQAFHAESAAFIRYDWHNVFANSLVPQKRCQDADKGHCGGNFAVAGAFQLTFELLKRRDVELG